MAATPKAKPAASAQRVSGARVLTSAQCVAILKEREEQKKKEQEEKEKRKIEREQKKQEREIAMKKRAEEREKKAAEKAKKAEELAKKREMRSKKKRVASTSAPVPKKKARIVSESSKNQPSTSRASTSSGATTSDEIDTNECCVCFRTYSEDVLEGTGLEWVECVCGRWLHEDCISYDISTDANGKELLCPFCCV